MSTKIYYGYRCSVKTFNEVFLPAFREHCLAKVQERIELLMDAVLPEKIREYYENKNWQEEMPYEEFLVKKEKFFRFRTVFKLACEASKDDKRNFISCLDCSLNVWLHKNNVYIIPYGETWIYDDFKLPEGAEDYSYWNNTDRPDEISNRKWNERRNNWEAVCLNDWNKSRLNHIIIDLKQDNFSLQPIANKIFDEKEAFGACMDTGFFD
jgi:hypothetical protein